MRVRVQWMATKIIYLLSASLHVTRYLLRGGQFTRFKETATNKSNLPDATELNYIGGLSVL